MYFADAAVTQWLNSLAGHAGILDTAMIWVSSYGVPLMVAAVALQWWTATERPRVRHAIVSSGLAFSLGLLLNQIILLGVHRVRPYDQAVTHLLIPPSADWSFPSDHATASLAIAATFLLLGLRSRGMAFLAAAMLIGFSRVYLGTHFVSDIIGAAVTGFAAALAVSMVYRPGSRLDRILTGIL